MASFALFPPTARFFLDFLRHCSLTSDKQLIALLRKWLWTNLRFRTKLVVAQFDVLETMTPFDFLDFRDLLMPVSGFQSLRFRLIEMRLGFAAETGMPFDDKAIEERLSGRRAALRAAGAKPSLFDLLNRWLARTPFLDWGGESFPRCPPGGGGKASRPRCGPGAQ